MKKFNLLTFVALVSVFIGCEKGGTDNVSPTTAEKIIGNWVIDGEDFSSKLTFGKNTWTQQERNYETSGTYSINGDILTMKIGDSLVNEAKVTMLYDYNTLVLRFKSPYGEDWGIAHEFALYYRENATIAATQADIQGKWFWYMHGDRNTIRGSLEFKGNTFDFIIPVWSERMKGTYEYVNGIIKFHVTEFLVRDYLDEAPENLYLNWAVPETGSGHDTPSFGYDFQRPFVANGNEAFCIIANLPAYFEKQ
ncbi:MAG: hypothetical protein SPJ13_06920 [Bacteroidales bacterium]|nr:hypothetical protein [Bacteroidales bacterium]